MGSRVLRVLVNKMPSIVHWLLTKAEALLPPSTVLNISSSPDFRRMTDLTNESSGR